MIELLNCEEFLTDYEIFHIKIPFENISKILKQVFLQAVFALTFLFKICLLLNIAEYVKLVLFKES